MHCIQRLKSNAVTAIEALFHNSGKSPQWLSSLGCPSFGPTDWHFGVFDSDQVLVGYLHLQAQIETAEIFELLVHQAARRQGIGRKLLKFALDALSTQETIHECWLEVRESNQAALHLYMNENFHFQYRRKGYYPPIDCIQTDTEDALVFCYTFSSNADPT